MYTKHFSLESLPFENVPDPAYFFNQGEYSRVLGRMIDSLSAGRGLMVMAGPIGTGKTTLSQKLMVSVPQKTRIVWLGEPPETSDELLLFLTQELRIDSKSPGRIFVLRDIKEYLQKLHEEENRCLLIIDEVHKISDDVLECVRLLNNLEQGSTKLIQIFLIGQEEFLANLNRPELASFKQRIAWLEAMGKMNFLQTREYILHRLKVAGGQSSIFSDEAIEAVLVGAQGTPRLVNTLCDRALRFCYEANKTTVDLDCVRRAADDIGLGSEVFLWLMNLKKKAKQAELQDSHLPDTPRVLAPNQFEPIEKVAKRVDRKKSKNEWLDQTIWMLADSPLLLLFISTLLFAVSLWFYKVYTGGE